MQDQVRTAIVNMVAERDGKRVAAWSTVRSILAEVSELGWQRVWRMVGAMPADAHPVVTSAFADTPMDVRGRVREIIATRSIAGTLHDQCLAVSVSRIEGVDQAGLAELEVAGFIAAQNVVYHLPCGGALVVTMDARGYRRAMTMSLNKALELPSLVYCKIEKGHDMTRRDDDETVACQSKPMVIVAEGVYADGHHGVVSHRKARRWRPSSPTRERSSAPWPEMAMPEALARDSEWNQRDGVQQPVYEFAQNRVQALSGSSRKA